MYTTTMSEAQDKAREIIESSIAEAPDFCACGRPMTIETRDGKVWIECVSLSGKNGLRLALASGFHDWRAVELPMPLQAAA
jgi:hypothetical protein